jgi:Tol biopolymer transport system component
MTFNSAVNLESLEDKLSIEPPIDGRFSQDGQLVQFEPLMPFDYATTYSVNINPGLRGQNRLPSLFKQEKRFQVQDPQLLFLRQDNDSVSLWSLGPDSRSQKVTDEENSIWDFTIAPDNRGVLLSVLAEDGSDDLVLVGWDGQRHEVVSCDDSQCREGHWQPGGSLVAYERKFLDKPVGETEVWLLDTTNGQSRPVHDTDLLAAAGVETQRSRYPRWSADGRYLSYYQPEARMIVVLDMEGGQPVFIPANLEIMGDWSPTGYWLAYTELAFGAAGPHGDEESSDNENSHSETGLFSHLVVTNLISRQTVDMSQDLDFSDGQPSWAPDGEMIALARTGTGAGRQIWLLNPQTKQSMAITDDPFTNHSAITWSPDGRHLAFMRTDLSGDDTQSLWLLDLQGDRQTLVEEAAFRPDWKP